MTKLTRAQLVIALSDCQSLFSRIQGEAANDRNPNRGARVHALTQYGFDCCLAVLSEEKPQTASIFGHCNLDGVC